MGKNKNTPDLANHKKKSSIPRLLLNLIGNKNPLKMLLKVKVKKVKIIIIAALVSAFLIICLLVGGGITAVVSIGNFLQTVGEFLFGKDDTAQNLENWMQTVNADELLEVLNNSKFIVTKEQLNEFRLRKEELTYLLKKCSDYEKRSELTREITIQGLREYTVTHISFAMDSEGNTTYSTSTELKEEYVDKKLVVTNANTESMLTMDWRLLYLFSLLNSMDKSLPSGTEFTEIVPSDGDPSSGPTMTEETDTGLLDSLDDNNEENIEDEIAAGNETDNDNEESTGGDLGNANEIPMVEQTRGEDTYDIIDTSDPENDWLISKKDIDQAFAALAMRYDYTFDVVRNSQSFYSYDECQALPHVTTMYGDSDSGSGKYTFYQPVSLINIAYSGYSDLKYVVSDNMVTGIQEYFSGERFDGIGASLSKYYTDDLYKTLLSLLPGGKRIQEQFDYYREQEKQGNTLIYNSFFNHELGDYTLSEDQYTVGNGMLPPVITIPGGGLSSGGNTLYNNPATVGEAAVNLAMSRLNWAYSQERRMENGYWDCSSMIGRCYRELGVNIEASITTMGLRTNAERYNQKIQLNEMAAGDILWFTNMEGSERHVIMYCGNGMVVHAASAKSGTRYQALDEALNNRSKTLQFCARPYKGLSSTWQPNANTDLGTGNTKASDFLYMTESEAALRMLALAVKDAKSSHILPSVTAAQMILESGYGKTGLSQKANNFFGIKAGVSGKSWEGSTWDGVSVCTMSTKEQTASGEEYSVNADFRKYATVYDSVADHSAYLLHARKGSSLRYDGLTRAADYRTAATIIKNGGYATDTKYVLKLCKIIEKYNLNRFDQNYMWIIELDGE